MSIAPNPGQQRVMSRPTEGLFVSAGAGTGKTYSLTRRFVSAADELDRVLTITFTDKAAGELIERIRDVLLDDGRIEDARAIDGAWVSTIHGFCRRVLKRYALEAGVDPYFSVLDDVAARSTSEECFEATTAALMVDDEGIEKLVLAYGLDTVRTAVMDVFARVRHLGRTVEDLVTEPPPRAEVVRTEALELIRSAVGLLADAKPGKTVERNAAALDDALAILADGADVSDLAGAASRLGDLASSASDAIREAVTIGRAAGALLTGAVAAQAAAGHAESLVRLIVAFERSYRAAKAERGALDFEDLQALTLELLQDRPDIATRYREHFRAVMVDEFQDTDALQLQVVEAVSGANLCTVGDEFQSIYGFRCADVEVFRGRARAVEARGDRARLELNYRSDPAVLSAVNEVFGSETFFGAGFERLEPGTGSAPACDAGELPHVQVLLTDHRREHAAKAREGEAAALARRIDEILAAGHGPSDVVILLRALTEAGAYADALAERGICAHIEGGGAFYEQDVVAEARCLLRTVANPLDEEALAVVLAGSASTLTDDALFLIAAERDRTVSLWERLAEAADLSLAAADLAEARWLREAVAGLREMAGHTSVSRTLRAAIRMTGLDAAASSADTGVADLEKLVRIAEEYQRRDGSDLTGFLEHLATCERHARREPRAMEAAPEDAVRVMTVHRAKGLEFPVVVVGDLGRAGRGDRSRALATPREGRVVLALVAPSEGERPGAGAQTPAFAEMLQARREQEAEEGDRVLYVACTRAERMLVISGATDMSQEPKASADIDRFRSALGIGIREVGEHEVMVGNACARVSVVDADVAVAAGRDEAARVRGASSIPSRTAARGEDTTRGTAEADDGRHVATEPYDAPATVSFTDLDAYRRCPYRWWLRRRARLPEPWESGQGSDPRALGTAVHAALQIGADDAALESIAAHARLDVGGVERLRSAVERFAIGPLGRRLARSSHTAREMPFALELDGTVLVGAIDVLADEDDRTLIVDYKTGTPDSSPGEPLSESRQLQAACYALAGRACGAETVEVAFAYVEHEDEDRSLVLDPSAIDEAVDTRVRPLLQGIMTGRVEPRDSFDAVVCRSCPGLGGLCPRRPRPGSRPR